MPRIVLYTTQWCGFCIRAKALLDARDLDFEEVSLDDDPAFRQSVWDLGRQWTVPLVMIDGDLVEFVRDLKQQPGGEIGVHASISVAQVLLAADVVDELRLVIAPAIAGHGRRLFDGLPAIRLESIRSETSPTGSLLVDYRVVR